jgi:hypothetical protein
MPRTQATDAVRRGHVVIHPKHNFRGRAKPVQWNDVEDGYGKVIRDRPPNNLDDITTGVYRGFLWLDEPNDCWWIAVSVLDEQAIWSKISNVDTGDGPHTVNGPLVLDVNVDEALADGDLLVWEGTSWVNRTFLDAVPPSGGSCDGLVYNGSAWQLQPTDVLSVLNRCTPGSKCQIIEHNGTEWTLVSHEFLETLNRCTTATDCDIFRHNGTTFETVSGDVLQQLRDCTDGDKCEILQHDGTTWQRLPGDVLALLNRCTPGAECQIIEHNGTEWTLVSHDVLETLNRCTTAEDCDIIRHNGTTFETVSGDVLEQLRDCTDGDKCEILQHDGTTWQRLPGDALSVLNRCTPAAECQLIEHDGTSWVVVDGDVLSRLDRCSPGSTCEILQHDGTSWVTQSGDVLSVLNRCTPATECQLIEHDGTSWVVVDGDVLSRLDRCNPGSECEIIQHNGTNWVSQAGDVVSMLNRCTPAGPGCQTLQYNGSAWAVVDCDTTGLPPGTECDILQHDGTSWQVESGDVVSMLNRCTPGTTDCDIVKWDGTEWSVSAFPENGGGGLDPFSDLFMGSDMQSNQGSAPSASIPTVFMDGTNWSTDGRLWGHQMNHNNRPVMLTFPVPDSFDGGSPLHIELTWFNLAATWAANKNAVRIEMIHRAFTPNESPPENLEEGPTQNTFSDTVIMPLDVGTNNGYLFTNTATLTITREGGGQPQPGDIVVILMRLDETVTNAWAGGNRSVAMCMVRTRQT